MSAWKEAKTADGRTYYWNTETKKTSWEKPSDFVEEPVGQHDQASIDAAWKETTNSEGKTYYYNTLSRVTVWDPPEAYLKHKQNARPAPAFVAGGAQDFGGRDDDYGPPDRRVSRRDDRDHGLPQKPGYEGGRGGGMPWERDQRHENAGFRGAMPVKSDEPEYATTEQAEEAFSKMLRKHNIAPDTAWEDALRQVIREREYRALKDPKERRNAFDKYCLDVRAQEKGKEKERREKLKEDFRKMLATHDDIRHYTRWKTARPLIEREAVFKGASSDEERRPMFEEYILELKKKHAQEEIQKRENAIQDLDALLQALIDDPNTKWADAQASITDNERFASDDKFKALSSVDVLAAFDRHVKALDSVTNDAKQKDKRMHHRRERQARDNFKQLLQQMQSEGKIRAGTKWQDFHPLIASDERYLNLIGTPGSSPLDLFWDVAEEEERKLRSLRNDALDVLEDRRYEMTTQTTLNDFTEVMSSDPKTAVFTPEQLSQIYDRLMEKIKKRADEDRAHVERNQRKAVDALRSVIKHLEPPVRTSDAYEDVVPRLQEYDEFHAITDELARKGAFEKHIRRLKEKEEDDRERSRRDRDRDHRNGSRRDHERDREDRDRRHRTRTPEIDAYEADRRKAQADRERQYRKASFGLTPPPRERRDDRDDRYRRNDRLESTSMYDRERREREMERERSYISRADPRDKGRALDYGDDDAVGSHPGSVRKRRDSDGSAGGRRDTKRSRRTRTPEPRSTMLKEESPALQSGSEEGEIEEV